MSSDSNSLVDALDIIRRDVPISAAVQVMAVCGLILGSNTALTRWIAVSSLTPPPPSDAPTDTPAELPARGWGRIFNRQFAQAMIGPLIMGTIQILVLVVLPKYGTTTVQNVFWCTVLFISYMTFFEGATRTIFPVPSSVQYVNINTARKFNIKQSYIGKYPHRLAISALLSLAMIGTVSQGIRVMIPIASGACTAAAVSGFSFPRLTMRHALMCLNAYIFGIPLVSLLIGGIVTLVEMISGKSDPSTSTTSKPDTSAYPSEWVGELMFLFMSTLPALFPGVLVSLALRYDYSRSQAARLVVPAGPGEAVQIPTSFPSFPRPFFTAAVTSLGASILTLKTLAIVYPIVAVAGFDVLYIFVTVPVVSLALFLRAKSLGQTREWWMYEERWLPKVEKDNAAPAADDVEAKASEPSDDEAAKLLTDGKDDKRDE